ncbi:MAG: tRNA 2-selenouridine(34) synthase MnmH [Cyanobacteria bacterium P01_A01_bin.84]
MALFPKYTQKPWRETYSEIIDVRSPEEFAEDRIPGAVNLPVLNNQERAEVGTIYKQVSPFQARKIGAALVYKNLSRHLKEHFADKEKDYTPLVYCWRGGQRSASMAWLLTQVGWRTTILEGGYKTYRAYVRHNLETLPSNFEYRVLRGKTGTGKTRILRRMLEHEVQVLDLEALANHRGSLLGEKWQGKLLPQPSQKRFDSLLIQALQRLNPEKVVWVESESNKIGKVYLPKSLWQKMKSASCIEIQLSMQQRVQFLIQEYPHLIHNPDILKVKLEGLKSRYGWKKILQWYNMIDDREWQTLFQDFLLSHYDPSYDHSMQRDFSNLEKVIPLPDLSDRTIEKFIDSLVPQAVVVK